MPLLWQACGGLGWDTANVMGFTEVQGIDRTNDMGAETCGTNQTLGVHISFSAWEENLEIWFGPHCVTH